MRFLRLGQVAKEGRDECDDPSQFADETEYGRIWMFRTLAFEGSISRLNCIEDEIMDDSTWEGWYRRWCKKMS